jgi:ubiquinone/menaquinone biosynthesis C-methylase UbiE
MSDVESFVRFCGSDFGDAVMAREATHLSEPFEQNDRVLDLGAGIGSIQKRLPGHDIVGLEISEGMVQTVRSRVDGRFVLGDARTLPITTDALGAVFFVATLEFIREVETGLSEAVRVFKPDGVLAALVSNTRSNHVRSSLKREDSHFQQIVHRDTEELASTIDRYVDTDREYFLGIRDRAVFETADPERAAILAVRGQPFT